MTEAPPGQNWEFDGFTMLTEMRLLLSHGIAVPLTPKAFDTLAILIANRDRVVTKDELLRSVWPDVVVEEGNLTQQIFLLRKALGESAQQSRYIVTVPGRGYRFTARVKAISGGAPPPAEASVGGGRSIGIGSVAIGAALLAIALGIAWWTWHTGSPPLDLAKASIEKITESGKAAESAASADGRYVAYVEDDGDQHSLWVVKRTGSGGRAQVVAPQTDVIAGLTFSPDGEFLYFARQRRMFGNFALWRIPTIGGVETPVLDDVDTPISFSPGGERFVFARGAEGKSYLFVAQADGGSPKQLATLKHPKWFALVGPDWSPDGTMVAAVTVDFQSTGPRSSIVLFPVDGSPVKKPVLYSTASLIGRIRWLPDGSGVLAPISEALTRQFPPWHARPFRFSGGPIWHIGHPGGHAQQLTFDLADYDPCCLDLAADRTRVTGVTSLKNTLVSDMWIAPIDDLNARTRITSGAPIVTRHGWLPDSDTMVYRDLGGHLKAVRKDKGEVSFLLPEGLKVAGGVSVCGDGRYIVFQGVPGNNIWRVSANGGGAVAITSGSVDSNPACSPDGQSVMYWSNRAPNVPLWSVPIEGGDPKSLVPSESYDSLPSPNRLLMYYSTSRGEGPTRSGEWVIKSLSDEQQPLLKIPSPRNMTYGVAIVWAPDSSGLDYVVTTRGVSNIWRQRLTGEQPVQLTHYTSEKIFSFAWSPDGKWLSFASGANRSDVVTLLPAR